MLTIPIHSWEIIPFSRLCIGASLLTALALWISPISLPHEVGRDLLGEKMTFLSIMLAAGFFQYGYFYETFSKVYKEWVPNWEGWLALKQVTENREKVAEVAYENKMDTLPLNLRESIARLNLQVTLDKKRLEEADEIKVRVLNGFREDVDHFLKALSIQFGIGSCLLLSVFADIGFPFGRFSRLLAAASFTSLLVSLILFAVMLIYYAGVVKRQFGLLRNTAEQYKNVRFS